MKIENWSLKIMKVIHSLPAPLNFRLRIRRNTQSADSRKFSTGKIDNWSLKIKRNRRKLMPFAIGTLLILLPVVLYSLYRSGAAEASWWQGNSGNHSWLKRQRLTLVNDNASESLATGTTVAVTVNTKNLVDQGKLQSDCDDLRVVYQTSTDTELTRYLSYPGGGNCATSEATKVYFQLSDTLANNGDTDSGYYMYFDNPQAETPTSTVDAFDTASANALLVCPFDGTTDCVNSNGLASATTSTGAIRYSGSKSALRFAGISGDGDDVDAGSDTFIDNIFLNKTSTVEFWTYLFSAGNGNVAGRFFMKGGTDAYINWVQYRLYFAADFTTTNGRWYTPTSSFSLNQWNHVAIVYNGSSVDNDPIIFINGISQTVTENSTPEGTYDDSVSTLYFGSNGASNNAPLDGVLDEVRISNVARYSGNFSPQTTPFVRDEHATILYHFDENGDDPRSATTAFDDSGNGNDGTITGAKYVAGLVGTDASTTDTGKAAGGNTFAGHEGVFIEEATTNKIPNPSFENATYDTGWTGTGPLTYTDGYGGNVFTAKDTNVSSGNPTINYGIAPTLDSTYKNLLEFDLSAIPTSATCNNATLYLYKASAGGSSYVTGTVYSIASDNDGWPEGNKVGVGVAGDSCWNYKEQTPGSETPWAGSAGLSTADTDYESSSIGTWNYYSSDLAGTEYQISLNTTRVADWFGASNTNYGILITKNMAGGDFGSAENTTTSYRPKLVVNYTNGTATQNTTAPYYKFGSSSAKIVAAANTSFVTSVDPDSTATHTLSAYVYDGTTGNIGGTVDDTVAKLITEGTTQTTTYTDMGGGWWRLSYTDTSVADEAGDWGVEVQAGKTVYIDGVQLEAKAYPTTYADGSLESDAGGSNTYFWDDDCDGTLDAGEDETADQNAQCSTRTEAFIEYTAGTDNIDPNNGSLSFWLKPSIGVNADFSSKYIFSISSDMWGRWSGSNWVLFSIGGANCLDTDPPPVGSWINYVITWTGSTVVIYHNGTAIDDPINCPLTGFSPFGTDGISFGSYNTNDAWSNDTISDTRIYGDATTPAEVADLYYSGLVSHSDQYEVDAFTETKGQNPIAIYHFDENYGTTAHDSSPYAHDLTVTGATWDTNTLKLDGSDDMASRSAGLAKDFNMGTDNFTITAKVRHPSAVTGTDTITAKYDTAGYKLYMNSSGYICFGIDDDSTFDDDIACTATSYADSKWHTVEAVKSTSLSLYVDGIAVASDQSLSATASLNNTANFAIGVNSNKSDYWDGFIDEVYIYPYARSATQTKADVLGHQTSASFGGRSLGEGSLDQGLVGYWKMDESSGSTVTDSSGNNNNGDGTGHVPTSSSGKFGNGLNFNGTSQWIDLGHSDTLQPNNITISVWAKPNTSSNGNNFIFGKGDHVFLTCRTDFNNSLESEFYGLDNDWRWEENVCVHDQWQLLTVTFDGKTRRHYRNGVLLDEWVETGSINYPSGYQAAIGSNYLGNVRYFDGSLDELRIYNRALSSAEVQDLYEWAPGPVGYWKMDENTGSYAYDSSGNGNTGTLSSGITWKTGKFGSSVDFTSSDKVVNCGETTSLTDLKEFTAEAWIYPRSLGESNTGVIISKEGGGDNLGWAFSLSNSGGFNNLRFMLSRETEDLIVTADYPEGTIYLNTWQHVVVVYDDSLTAANVKLYINGILIPHWTELDGSGARLSDSGWNLGIGNVVNGTGQDFDGQIDEVKVYNYARSQQQIVSDMMASHPSVALAKEDAIGHWDFDEGFGDTAHNIGNGGSSLNGNLAGVTSCPQSGDSACPTWTNSGKFGKALNFSTGGTTFDYVEMGNPNITVYPFTMSAWFKGSGASEDIISLANSGADNQYYSLNNGVVAQLVLLNGGESNTVSGTTTINNDSWHHIVGVFNSSTERYLYVDGKLENSSSTTVSLASVDRLEVGRRADSSPDSYVNGSIDEVKIYNFALTEDQVKMEYNQGSASVMGAVSTESSAGAGDQFSASAAYCIPGDTATCTTPVAEYKLDENTGQYAYDTSENGYNLTLGTTTGADINDPSWINGKKGSALSFDGTNDTARYDESGSTSLDLTSSFTLGAWVNFGDTITNLAYTKIMAKNRCSNGCGYVNYWIEMDDEGVLTCAYYDPSSNRAEVKASSFDPTVGSWYHISCAHDDTANMLTLYINGSYNNSAATGAYEPWTGDGYFTIGNDFAETSSFKGKIDDVKIFDYARTPAQIAWDYNKGAPLAYYRFDECTGDTLYDTAPKPNKSDTGYNGTITEGGSGSNDEGIGSCSVSGDTMWNGGATGKYSSSLEFDGTDDYISKSSYITNNLNNWALSAWIYPTSLPQAGMVLYNGDDDGGYGFGIFGSAGESGNNLWMLYGGVGWKDTGYTFPSANTWYQITIERGSDNTPKVFINGRLIQTLSDFTGDPNTVSSYFTIGSELNSSHIATRFFAGQIDDVRIYNYALTATQIKNLYNYGAVHFGN